MSRPPPRIVTPPAWQSEHHHSNFHPGRIDDKYTSNLLHAHPPSPHTASSHEGSFTERENWSPSISSFGGSATESQRSSAPTDVFDGLRQVLLNPEVERAAGSRTSTAIAHKVATGFLNAQSNQARASTRPLHHRIESGYTQNRVRGSDASSRGSYGNSPSSYGGRDESAYGGDPSEYGGSASRYSNWDARSAGYSYRS